MSSQAEFEAEVKASKSYNSGAQRSAKGTNRNMGKPRNKKKLNERGG